MDQVIEQGRTAGKTLLVDGIDYEVAKEFLVVRLSSEHKLAKRANYTLSMNFVASLSDASAGLFRSAYMEDGVERYGASSVSS